MTRFFEPLLDWPKQVWRKLFPSDDHSKHTGGANGVGIRPPPLYELEVPEGVVRIGSPFYVRRTADVQLEKQFAKGGTVSAVSGAHQTGKTSLLARAVEHTIGQGHLALRIDTRQILGKQPADNLDQFLGHVVCAIAAQAKIDTGQVRSAWDTPLSSKLKMTDFLERFVLKEATNLVCLVVDNADAMLDTSYCAEFFGLFRSWHNRSTIEASWKKLNIVFAISVHPSLLIDDVQQSPFNVGTRIELDDFKETQVRELNEKHGNPLRSREIPPAMSLLGGHPYLIRQALYTLVSQELTWPELDEIAADRVGPFGIHLDYTLGLLQDPGLLEAMRKILEKGTCPEAKQLLRLNSVRLIKQQGRKCICRYRLYDRFYRSQLL